MTILDAVSSIIFRSLSEPHAGLLTGILFGTKTTLSKSFTESLIATGTIHIVALSGMNITLLITFVQLLCLRFLKRPIANAVSVGIIIGFICVVGPSPSVVRAAIMGCISLLAVNFGRKNIPIYTLILAVMGMVLLNPLWVVDIGFQLSVFATLGIILFAKKSHPVGSSAEALIFEQKTLSDSLQKPVRSNIYSAVQGIYAIIEEDLRVTLAAQVFTVPIILFHFQRLSLIAPLTNVLIGWLIAPIMVLGFIMILVGFLWLPLAQLVGMGAWVLLSTLISIVDSTAKIPFASIAW